MSGYPRFSFDAHCIPFRFMPPIDVSSAESAGCVIAVFLHSSSYLASGAGYVRVPVRYQRIPVSSFKCWTNPYLLVGGEVTGMCILACFFRVPFVSLSIVEVIADNLLNGSWVLEPGSHGKQINANLGSISGFGENRRQGSPFRKSTSHVS